ncbi:MAG: DUF839 domain-containing protein, partial [Bacteroidia bacterium]|nr:DUF839 domain-containing protein [Bacteroidia bacterium]
MVIADDRIGDGGGMTAFKVARDPETNQLVIIDQTLEDGRKGKFFNVEFVNTVGNTGMNCAGITSLADGRIWTAEEWFRYGIPDLTEVSDSREGSEGIRNVDFSTTFTIPTDGIPGFAGLTIPFIDNLNWMVEIDPRQAAAIRKQYNWGRQGFEGGVVMPDNKTVYLGEDNSPGLFTRFIADEPGDFTKGTLSYYAWDEENERGYWVDYPINSIEEAVAMNAYNSAEFSSADENPSVAINAGGARPWRGENAACMFIRNEWVAADTVTGRVYWAETGNDNFRNSFSLFTPRGGSNYVATDAEGNPTNFNGKIGRYLLDAARMRFPELNNISNDSLRNWLVAGNNFRDAHGRILCYNPATQDVTVFLEGGPYPGDANAGNNQGGPDDLLTYPETHFSNPDGLHVMYIGDKRYLVICEDLNGRSFNRVPSGTANSTCDLFLLDMDKEPKIENLIRISQVPL